MRGWSTYSTVLAPVLALGVVGLLALLLRWTFSGGGSVVARKPQPGDERNYGLLVSVASPATYIEGELARQRLLAAGVRATLATTNDGPRLMVFASDERKARSLLAAP